MFGKLALFLVSMTLALHQINAHAYLSEPVNRGSAWRKDFDTPKNFDDNQNYCGGLAAFAAAGGKCGECGDLVSLPRPRPSENTGVYGKGVIVRTYNSSQLIDVTSTITQNHGGHVAFALCPLKGEKELETNECFGKYPLKFEDGSYEKRLQRHNGEHEMKVHLPEGLKCEHCVLQWTYTASNNWGKCEDGTSKTGCGIQETFRTCSDVKII